MISIIHPGEISGNIQAPASKSSMQRACAAALVKKGISTLHNPGKSNDDLAALSILKSLGVLVSYADNGSLVIDSSQFLQTNEPVTVHCGESGLGIRMFTPILSLLSHEVHINGSGSLLKRPMHFFDEVLPQLNVSIHSTAGYLPITVQGPLKPQNITIDGSLSSQYLTGLLLAYSAAGAKEVVINVKGLNSKPYVDLTLEVMRQFGLAVPENRNYEQFVFNDPLTTKPSESYTIEGDWSGGAFLLVAGAIAGSVMVKGLSSASTQADKKIMMALADCGAQIRQENNLISVERPKTDLLAFGFDATDCPDLFPPLAALAACCTGTSRISGVHRLTHKESNRALTLQDELGKMNIPIYFEGDEMCITGNQKIKRAQVSSRHDHRIAMACAVAGLRADGPVTISDAEAVNKSYPDFYTDLTRLQQNHS